jgi:hypothetical protein
MRILLLLESLDFRPSGQCTLVSVIPSCFCFVNIYKSPVEMQHEILDVLLLRKVYAVYVDWRAGSSSCGECDVDRILFVSFPSLRRVALVRTDI